MEHGADPHAVAKRHYRVFIAAVGREHLELVRSMLEDHGADVHLADDKGIQAVHSAATTRNISMLELLIEHGADINAQSPRGTPLLMAVDSNEPETASFLLERGADPNGARDGWSPLTAAVDLNSTEMIQALLDHGANVMFKDSDGWTALHMAAMNGNNRILAMLLDAPGADIDVATEEGRTLVHQAAKSGRTDTLKWLVERGANVTAVNASGETALDLAIKGDRTRAADYLRSLGSPQ
jgi:ankyrin repeat protein